MVPATVLTKERFFLSKQFNKVDFPELGGPKITILVLIFFSSWRETGLGIKETQNTLVFQVAPKATKTEIKEAVQAVFKVKVASVRTANYPGKERRRGKFTGYRPDWKKAYVRLKAGEKMPEYAQNL